MINRLLPIHARPLSRKVQKKLRSATLRPHDALAKAVERIYEEARRQSSMRLYRGGFVILHSKPLFRPAVLVLGDQPSGKSSNRAEHYPPSNQANSLGEGKYLLALVTSAVFYRAGVSSVLQGAQFFDINFFRPPPAPKQSKRKGKSAHEPRARRAWSGQKQETTVKRTQRLQREFCRPFVDELILTLRPRRIVTLGREVLESLLKNDHRQQDALRGKGMLELMSDDFRFAYRGIPVVPLTHLSGKGSDARHFSAAISAVRRNFAL